MILQSRSLGCSILLLMIILGTTSSISKFIVLKSGILPISKGDVAMVFYAQVENTGKEPQTVQLSMKRCCLETEANSVDCNAMKLQHGFSVRVHPNKTFNLSAYYINKNLFGRDGECELKLMRLSGGAPLTEFKIQFNTTAVNSNFFQSIYRTMTGSYNTGHRNDCDASDHDCQSSECVLDYSGSRSFYNVNKKACEPTPKCPNEKHKMLSPVTNLCREQYPSAKVLTSLTMEMKESINDSDVVLQRGNPVEPIKVICVNGKMEADGHCKCDENWISVKFEPQKVDPQKSHYMCNVRSPEGEVTDRTISTGYAYTILIILVLILLPCCTGLGIMGLYLYRRNQKRKKSIEVLSKDLASSRPDKSDDVISEITSRREVKKSSTSRRSFNGQEPTTRSHSSILNDSNSKHEPPPSPHDPPSSPHDPPASPHDPPTPHSSNSNLGNSNGNPGKQGSNVNQSNIQSRKYLDNQPLDLDAHRHPTTASHVYWNKVKSKHTSRQNQDNYLQDFQEIPLIDLEHAVYDDYHENSAFRSRSAPIMTLSYSTPELIAVPDDSGNSTTAYISTSRTLNAIPQENLSNNNPPPDYMEYQPFDAHAEPSETDIRASVKRKQELWADFLRNYSETRPLRQHSEFGIQDYVHNAQQAYQARSLPIMHTNITSFQRNDSNSPEQIPEYLLQTRTSVFKGDQQSGTSIKPPAPPPSVVLQPFSNPLRQHSAFGIQDSVHNDRHPNQARSLPIMHIENSMTRRNGNNSEEMLKKLLDTRTYTVFNRDQQSGTSITPPEASYAIPEPFSIPSTVDLDEVEQMLSAAMKSKERIHLTEQEMYQERFRPKTMERIENYTVAEKNPIFSRENLSISELERMDSFALLKRLSQDNNDRTASSHSSSTTSDILIGSPIGRNKFWFQKMTGGGNDDMLKSQLVDSRILLEQFPQKNNAQVGHLVETSSSESSDIAIGSPTVRNQFWVRQLTTSPSAPNDTPNANEEQETNPYQLTATLKQQLIRIPSNPCNSSTNYLNPDMVASNSRYEDSNPPLNDPTGSNINQQTQQLPLDEEDENSTLR